MNKMLAGDHRVFLIRQQDQNKDQTITGQLVQLLLSMRHRNL